MADELIDIYDEDMHHLGTAMKSQAHNEGLWHNTFRCWIIRRDGRNRHIVWLQYRGKEKSFYPNRYGISVAGHLKAGETPKDGIREIEEKIGLKVTPEKLTKLFVNKAIYTDNGTNNREFCNNYLLETGKELFDSTLNPAEVDGLYEAEVEDVIDLLRLKDKYLTITGLSRKPDGGAKSVEKLITIDDLVPHGNDYYMKIMESIQRYFNGK